MGGGDIDELDGDVEEVVIPFVASDEASSAVSLHDFRRTGSVFPFNDLRKQPSRGDLG